MPHIDISSRIDHTLLDKKATSAEIKVICEQALQFGFKGVCVFPEHVAEAAGLLAGSNVVPISVVGFPTGLDSTSIKVDQTCHVVREGAREIDMVINQSWLKGSDYRSVLQDIGAVVAQAFPCPVKVILETGTLTRELKIIGAALAKAAGAAFVKTSTGFGAGATVEDVALLRSVVGPDMGIKASGGIADRKQALAMIEAGADRLGTSKSLTIIGRN